MAASTQNNVNHFPNFKSPFTMATSPTHNFQNECKEIHDSLSNLHILIPIFMSRDRFECKQIREAYKALFGEDLIQNFQNQQNEREVYTGLCMLMLDAHESDTIVVREALERSGDTNFKALIEIFVGSKSSRIRLIKQDYRTKYRRNLDQDIIKIEPPHSYQKILIALGASHNGHQDDISQHIAKCDAKRLYETGEANSGAIQEHVLLEIFTKRSIPQLKLTFSCYKHIYGHDYTKTLKKGNFFEFEDALRVVIKCMLDPSKYYAKELYANLKGTSADKGKLIRIMVRRSEIDMDKIRKVFEKKYEIELKDAISDNAVVSDNCRDFLLCLASNTVS